MSSRHPNVRSQEERNALVEQFQYLPQHVVNSLWSLPSVQRLGHDDAVQIGFEHLIRAAELWEESRGVSFKTYAYKSVLSGVKDASMKRKYIPLLTISGSILEECPSGEPEKPPVLKVLERELFLTELMHSIDLLPPRLKMIIMQTCWHGKTYSQVAKKHHITKERVRQLRDRALRWLRAYLDGENPPILQDGISTRVKKKDD